MTVLPSIAVTVTAAEAAACMPGSAAQPIADGIDIAVQEANRLIEARAVCTWVEVVSAGPAALRVVRAPGGVETTFATGPGAGIWRHAGKLLVGVVTIGPRLDARVRELNRSREPLGAYLLDCAGLAALQQAGAALCRLAEAEARRKQWGVGHCAAPGGTAGWPLTDQPKLCGLLALELIGVCLADGGALIPLKSVASVIPIGAGYPGRQAGSSCRHCRLRHNCRMEVKR